MNLTGFNDQQRQALVDLLTLGMYADGKLDLIEEEKAQRVLDAIQFSTDSERQRFIDDSFTRARKYNVSPEAVRKYVAEIARHLPTPAIRQQAYAALEDSLASDNQIADKEKELLVVVTEEFKL